VPDAVFISDFLSLDCYVFCNRHRFALKSVRWVSLSGLGWDCELLVPLPQGLCSLVSFGPQMRGVLRSLVNSRVEPIGTCAHGLRVFR